MQVAGPIRFVRNKLKQIFYPITLAQAVFHSNGKDIETVIGEKDAAIQQNANDVTTLDTSFSNFKNNISGIRKVTQAEYNALPSTKNTDNVLYFIKK